MKIYFLPKKPTNIHPTHCPPSPTKQSSTPTLVGQLMIKDYYVMMTVFGYRTPTISISGYYSIITITLSQDITAKTRHWTLSKGIICGWVSDHSSKIIASLVRIAPDPKHPDTDHMETSDNFQFQKNHGIQYQWTSLNNYHLP